MTEDMRIIRGENSKPGCIDVYRGKKWMGVIESHPGKESQYIAEESRHLSEEYDAGETIQEMRWIIDQMERIDLESDPSYMRLKVAGLEFEVGKLKGQVKDLREEVEWLNRNIKDCQASAPGVTGPHGAL